MKKRYIFLFLCSFILRSTLAQVVTTVPAFPTAEAEITLIFDLTKATDSRAKGLLGKQDDVYLWSGAGSTETGPAFEFQPAGQSDFSKPFAPGKMTSLGNDRWQIKLVPERTLAFRSAHPSGGWGCCLKVGMAKLKPKTSSSLFTATHLFYPDCRRSRIGFMSMLMRHF